MKSLDFGRHALCGCVAAAMLAGCGLPLFDSAQGRLAQDDMQSPIDAPGAMQSRAITTHAAHRASWMLPEAKGEDLLYVSNAIYTKGDSDVLVFSYPRGKQVGTLTGFSQPLGECIDKSGDVFITDSPEIGSGLIYEYAHGGNVPIETLTDPLAYPNSCAIDPMTGNLAVINVGGVAVFPNARGNPRTYMGSSFDEMTYGGYDPHGNLFVDGTKAGTFVFAELRSNEENFTNIAIRGSFRGAGSVQWDGKYITATTDAAGTRTHPLIDQLQIYGSTGTIVGMTTLTSGRNRYNGGQFVIFHNKVIGNVNDGSGVAYWLYPSGGAYAKRVRYPANSAWGIAVSVAPH